MAGAHVGLSVMNIPTKIAFSVKNSLTGTVACFIFCEAAGAFTGAGEGMSMH